MMKIQFSLALFAVAAQAKCSKQIKAKFQGAAAAFGWDKIQDVHEMEFRMGVFSDNQHTVDNLNKKNKGVSFAMNGSGNLTDEEFARMQGAKPDLEARAANIVNGNGRHLNHEKRALLADPQYNINWVDEGVMTPVKNQSYCGSCWAFAASSVMEGMEAIQNGHEPVRQSEQEAVDCVDKAYGCKGGWMNYYWDWTKDNGGAQSNEAYPYEKKTLECRNQENKVAIATSASRGRVQGVDAMIEQL